MSLLFRRFVFALLLGSVLLSGSSLLQAQRIVIDNLTSGQSPHAYTQSGTWTAATTPPGFQGAGYALAEAGAAATAARWRPNITTAGNYKIYLRWPASPDRSERVAVEIASEGGSRIDGTRRLNQRVNGGVWVFVGTYHLSVGTGNSVLLRASADGSVAADAALFELSYATTTKPTYPAPTTPRQEYNDPNWRLNPEQVDLVRLDTAANGVAPFFQLRVAGEPYEIRGACGHEAVAEIAAAGGNTLRLYSTNPLGDVSTYLQNASENGLKVLLGLFLVPADPGPNRNFYEDPVKVAAQFEAFKLQIDAYKHHDAILAWSIGNEIDPADHPNGGPIYQAIDQIAQYIREVDHYHPAMTSHAASHQVKIAGVTQWAPHVDIIGINSYERNIGNVYPNVLAAGWTGPYVVTEWSVEQPQQRRLSEGNVTSYGSVVELVSAEKFVRLQAVYQNHLLPRADRCLGSFAFKGAMGAFRITHTWYPMLDENLKPTPSYDAMRINWGGPAPAFTAPQVTSITINGLPASPGVTVSGAFDAEVTVTADPGADLWYLVEIRPEVAMSVNTPALPIPDLSVVQDAQVPGRFRISPAGLTPGQTYRLYYYVRRRDATASEGYNSVGTANIPFQLTASGEVVAEYAFSAQNFNNTASSALATAATMVNAAGGSVSGSTFSFFKTNTSNNIPESLAAALTGGHYLGFTVTPGSDPVNLERLGFAFGLSNDTTSVVSYEGSWAVFSDATGLTSGQELATGSFSAPADSGASPRWNPLAPSIWLTATPALQGITAPVQFRIYFWDNTTVGSNSLVMRFDSIVLAAAAGQPGFASWQQGVFTGAELLNPAISGPKADADRDGRPNLLEYALGTDPRSADLQALPAVTEVDGEWVFTYQRPAQRPDIGILAEASLDLVSWNSDEVGHLLVGTDGGTETWQVGYPADDAAGVFLRLRVELEP